MTANDPDSNPDDAAWDDLLRQLRAAAPAATPRPYFYQRVRARLEAETASAPLPGWLRRPAYAVAVGVLVLVLNVGAAVRYARSARPAAGPPDAYAAFVTEYQLEPLDLPHE